MKKLIIVFSLMLILFSCDKGSSHQPPATDCGFNGPGTTYSKADTLQKLAKEYTASGVPGLVITVYSPQTGYWGTSAGYADLEAKKPMTLCQLQYLQSVSKTYMAVAILQLKEKGKLNLDAAITDYLPERYAAYLDKPSTITVRNLLNHTSGLPDYLDNPAYVNNALTHPEHIFTSDEFLSYVKDEPLRFAPGTQYQYCNTNYHLLALIADAISGNHEELIRNGILKPNGLDHTMYRNIQGSTDIVSSYVDLEGTGQLQNVTELQVSSIVSAKGDDGIVATPYDAINFLKGWTSGRLLSATSMAEMTNWVKDENGEPVYGMGLFHVTYNGVEGIGHGGAGVGAGCGLYYFPAKDTYVFLGTNIGTLVDGPIVRKVNELKGKMLEIILK